jgi:CRP/FNR family transcriptional regulator
MKMPEKAGGTAAPLTCPSCAVHTSCFGQGAGADALAQLDAAVERRFAAKTGEYLYRIGDPFHSLYAIRSGCLKNSVRDDRGREHVMGFHMAGDVVGVGGIGREAYIFDVCALAPSEVCEVPFERLEDLAHKVPALGRNILRIFGRYRNRDAGSHSLRRNESAEARLASFLLDFSRRLQARGLDPASFRLPMSREDLANYLGLTMGGVGKAFAQLEERKVAKVSGKSIKVSSIEALRSLAASLG